jgi:D-beta-D-heptose 7-phosphate kinase/D-beta-D-heptose 1-phosphate adenosyltransferase
MIKQKIFTNGCFDILHVGHVELLNYCATLGDVIVGLNSDLSVSRLKGKGRPINTAQDRKLLLLNLRSVSEVIIFNEDTPLDLIRNLKPDVIVKGGDYLANEVIGSELAEIKIFKFIEGYSSTSIINKISKFPENN